MLVALFSLCCGPAALAEPVTAQSPPGNAIGLHASFLKEAGANLISGVKLECQGMEIRFTASFGVEQRVVQCVFMDELISVADDRLYQSKREGRNRVSHGLAA